MTIFSTTTYKCDRCEESFETSYGEPQPTGWTQLLLMQPPKANPMEVDLAIRKVLCPVCTGKVLVLLNDDGGALIGIPMEGLS